MSQTDFLHMVARVRGVEVLDRHSGETHTYYLFYTFERDEYVISNRYNPWGYWEILSARTLAKVGRYISHKFNSPREAVRFLVFDDGLYERWRKKVLKDRLVIPTKEAASKRMSLIRKAFVATEQLIERITKYMTNPEIRQYDQTSWLFN